MLKIMFNLFVGIIWTSQLLGQPPIILTLDNVPPNQQCGQVWTENNLDVWFDLTDTVDCDGGGGCFFGIDNTSVWLFPARLMVDLPPFPPVHTIQIEVESFCDLDCIRAFLLGQNQQIIDVTSNSYGSGIIETLTLVNPFFENANELAVSACEGEIREIRIYFDQPTASSEIPQKVIKCYPNPVAEGSNLQIEIPPLLTTGYLAVALFNIDGRVIFSEVVTNTDSAQQFSINMKSLPPGVYLLHGQIDNQSFYQKIIRL